MFRQKILTLISVGVVLLLGCAQPALQKSPNTSPAGQEIDMVRERQGETLQTRVSAQQEEEEETEEEAEEEAEEEEEEEASVPAASFSYDEWTAAPPARGMPKIPGPPFSYLNSGGKKGAFDQLRKYRWQVWEYEQAVTAERDYLNKWREWERNIPQSTLDHMGKIQKRNLNICGYWRSSSEIPPRVTGFGPDYEELERLIIKFKKYQNALSKDLSVFKSAALVRAQGGEAASRWLNQLQTVVRDIKRLEKFIDGTMAARKIERDVLYAIDGCSDDMPLLNLCPHPFLYANLNNSDCDIF